MSDLSLKRLEDGFYDLDFDSVDLQTTDGLENAIILSLGSFARSQSLDYVAANTAPSTGGWWADAVDSVGPIGGNLYEAFPCKGDDAAIERLNTLANDSLQWMVEDGIASSISVSGKTSDNEIVLTVKIEKPDGSESNFAYEINWEATSEF